MLGTILCIGGSLIFTLWKGPYVTKAIFKEPLIDIYKNHDSGNSSGKDWIKGSAFILISDIAWSIWLILQVVQTLLLWKQMKYGHQISMAWLGLAWVAGICHQKIPSSIDHDCIDLLLCNCTIWLPCLDLC